MQYGLFEYINKSREKIMLRLGIWLMLTGCERETKATVKYYLLKKSSGRLDLWTFIFFVPKG